MITIAIKSGMVISTVGLLWAAPATILSDAKDFENLSVVGILGVCLMVCVAGMVCLYRDKEKSVLRQEKLIERTAMAMEANTKIVENNTGVMVEVKNAIQKCHHNG